MSKFQIILLMVFGTFIVAAVALFSFYRSSNDSRNTNVVVWGDITLQDFNLLLNTSTFVQDQTITARYVEKSAETIEAEFTEALAQGVGPDLIIITQDQLWKIKPKLTVIPYESIGERDFKPTFIEEGELFMDENGVYALPLSVDPLVLYYNRDLLSAAGQARPIQYWDELYGVASDLSKRDAAGNLISSAIALGEARNINNAKDILSLLLLQAGTPIVGLVGSGLRAQISANFDLPISTGEAALDFYTQFSNPTKAFYSWNRSLMDAQTHFTSGDSAYYLGFASELSALTNKNPTLNFGVSLVPQSRVSGKTITFGRLRGVAISRSTKNPAAALTMAVKLISMESAFSLSKILNVPPARRDILANRPSAAILSVFYDAALQSKGWFDPDSVATGVIFRDAIESVTSGRARTAEAVNKANKEVEALIK